MPSNDDLVVGTLNKTDGRNMSDLETSVTLQILVKVLAKNWLMNLMEGSVFYGKRGNSEIGSLLLTFQSLDRPSDWA